MAYNLLEYAKGVDNPKQRAVIQTFTSGSQLLQFMPFETETSGTWKYEVEEDIGEVGFRGLNDSFTTSETVINPEVEHSAILGVDSDTDRALIRRFGPRKRAERDAMKVKAVAHKFFYTLFKGDRSSDPKSFDGLEKRIPTTSAQAVDNGGGGLSLAKLDELMDMVEGDNKVLVGIKKVRRGLTKAARTTSVGGDVEYKLGQFGQQIAYYNNTPIIYADPFGIQTAALDESESGSTTSVYCLSLGSGRCHGFWADPINARDLGELQTGNVVYRTRIDADGGMVIEHPRCVARLHNIDATTAVVA